MATVTHEALWLFPQMLQGVVSLLYYIMYLSSLSLKSLSSWPQSQESTALQCHNHYSYKPLLLMANCSSLLFCVHTCRSRPCSHCIKETTWWARKTWFVENTTSNFLLHCGLPCLSNPTSPTTQSDKVAVFIQMEQYVEITEDYRLQDKPFGPIVAGIRYEYCVAEQRFLTRAHINFVADYN